MLVWHFSRFILFMATRSCLGVQRAACTTAVAPLPEIRATTEQWESGQERRGTHSTHSWKTTVNMAYVCHMKAFDWPFVFQFIMLFIAHVRQLRHETNTLTQADIEQFFDSCKHDIAFTWVITNQAHAGVVELFAPRSCDMQHIACQLLAADKEMQRKHEIWLFTSWLWEKRRCGGGGSYELITVRRTQLWSPFLSVMIWLVNSWSMHAFDINTLGTSIGFFWSAYSILLVV